ncbi:MAG: hypothetical protein V1776_05700 [Candidatus Diapherotrites archaeon]
MILMGIGLGCASAFFLRRSGFVSLFPFLLLFPSLSSILDWSFLIGLVGFLLASESFSPLEKFVFSRDIWVGFGLSIFALFSMRFFSFLVDAVEPFLGLGFVLLLFSLLFFSHLSLRVLLPGVVLCLVMGYFVLVRWSVPFALPSLLLGFFGFSFTGFFPSSSSSFFNSLKDALIGIAAGIFPGFGPGLLSFFWFSNKSSPSLGVANLVFSMGYLDISGNLRSVPAAILAEVFFPSWEWMVLWLFFAVWISMILLSFFPSPSESSIFLSMSISVLVLFLLGGVISLGVFLLSFVASHLLREWGLSPSLGLLVLIPPLLFFYA